MVEINIAGGFSRKYFCASIRTNWRRTWSQINSRGKDTYAVHEHHNHFKVHVRMTNLTAYTVLWPHSHLYKLPFFPFFFVKSKHLSMSHRVFVWKASLNNCNSLNCVIITQSKEKNHHSTWYNNLLQSVHFLFTFSI